MDNLTNWFINLWIICSSHGRISSVWFSYSLSYDYSKFKVNFRLCADKSHWCTNKQWINSTYFMYRSSSLHFVLLFHQVMSSLICLDMHSKVHTLFIYTWSCSAVQFVYPRINLTWLSIFHPRREVLWLKVYRDSWC